MKSRIANASSRDRVDLYSCSDPDAANKFFGRGENGGSFNPPSVDGVGENGEGGGGGGIARNISIF